MYDYEILDLGTNKNLQREGKKIYVVFYVYLLSRVIGVYVATYIINKNNDFIIQTVPELIGGDRYKTMYTDFPLINFDKIHEYVRKELL